MDQSADIQKQLTKAVKYGRKTEIKNAISTFGWSNINGYDLLRTAIEDNKTEVAELLLLHDCEISEINSNDGTLLNLALRKVNLTIIETLLEKGASLTAQDATGATPFHVATKIGLKCVVELLLAGKTSDSKIGDGNRFDLCDNDGKTPLRFAVEGLHHEIVELFLQKHADINKKANDGISPIKAASILGDENMLELLLKYGNKVDLHDGSGNESMLRLAVDRSSAVSVQNILTYCHVIPEKFNDLLKITIMKPLDNFKCCCGNCSNEKRICKLLVDFGFRLNEIDVHDDELVVSVVAKGYVTVLEVLLKNGLDVNKCLPSFDGRSETFLDIAIVFRQREVAALLLSGGAKIEFTPSSGTPLLFKAVDHLRDHCCTGFCCTSPTEDLQMVKLLLDFAANVDYKSGGTTVLHLSASFGIEALMSLLLEYDANPNLRDADGATALHHACKGRLLFMISYLLCSGADISSRDQNRCTVFDYLAKWTCTSHSRDFFVASPNLVTMQLQDHIVSLKKSGLFLSKTFSELPTPNITPLFDKKCEDLLASMKNDKIGNSEITYYNILTATLTELVSNLKQDFLSDVSVYEGCMRYHIYGGVLRSKLSTARRRRMFLDEIERFFYELFSFLPPVCVNKVIYFLTNQDLRRLVFLSKLVTQ